MTGWPPDAAEILKLSSNAIVAWPLSNTFPVSHELLHARTDAIFAYLTTMIAITMLSFTDLKRELLLQAGSRKLEGNNLKEAEKSLLHAIQIARNHKARSLEPKATMSLCGLWQKQGKKKEAQRTLGKIYQRFTEGFDTPI